VIHCPVCDKEMTREEHATATVDVCADHGLWLDKTELFTITENVRHNAAAFEWGDVLRREKRPHVDHLRQLNCPHCSDELAVENHMNVHVDWCKEHGIWMDSGELDALLNNLRLDTHYMTKVTTRLFELKF
jgi:Zn-finger nucleic acid-binding protein